MIVVFYRGFFCPCDNQQLRQLVQFQSELKVNYGQLVSISVQPPLVQAAFRAGLGAHWIFLADEKRALIKQISILDETEGEYAYVAQPYTFVLQPDHLQDLQRLVLRGPAHARRTTPGPAGPYGKVIQLSL